MNAYILIGNKASCIYKSQGKIHLVIKYIAMNKINL